MRNKNNDISEEALCAEYDALYHFALSLCHNEDDALDITQETFLKAIKSCDKFSGNSSLYTWLCAIAKNLWVNRLKKQSREMYGDGFDGLFVQNERTLEDRLDDKDIAEDIHRALHSINEPYKEVFSLRVFGELSFSQIARLFSKTESWARVTYHRAKIMISEAIESRKQ